MAQPMPGQVNILGIAIDDLTRQEALNRVEECIIQREPCYAAWLNLNQIILYRENARFRDIVDRARLRLTDGQSVIWIASLLHDPLKEKLGGTDFMLDVCELAARKGFSIFLLGGAPGTVQKAADQLQKKFSGLKIAGLYSPPYGFEKDAGATKRIDDMIRGSGADILFVGLGSPKQDYFIEENINSFNIPITFPVGSAIDMISGEVKMPPRWISKIGMAWFYRFCQEPKRLFRRYFVDSWKIFGYIREFKKSK